jgi:hypothetical protein
MKNIKPAITIVLLLLSTMTYSQIAVSDFAGVTWEVNQFYVDGSSFENATVDSLQYHFRSDGVLELRSPHGTVSLSYTFTPYDSVITILDPSQNPEENCYFKVVYADGNNFVFYARDINDFGNPPQDPQARIGDIPFSEFRMIPKNY